MKKLDKAGRNSFLNITKPKKIVHLVFHPRLPISQMKAKTS